MIRKSCFAAVAAVAVFSCVEKNADLPHVEEGAELVTFSVSVPGLETKSTGGNADDEKTINSLQVFVFNQHGVYEASAVADGADKSRADITCTMGEKRIVALVNASPETSVTSYQDLSDRTTYLKDSGVGDLVMVGETVATVSPEAELSIDVSYISSKVVLESVTLDFEDSQLDALDFNIESVYLINVAGDRSYIADSEPSIWYNMGQRDTNDPLTFLYDKVPSGDLVSGGAAYDTVHYFYCYQNPTQTKTRLVIEAKIDKQIYYYPIDVKELLPNNEYSYRVKLTRLGTDDPDGSLDKEAFGVTVTIKDWVRKSSDVTI